MKYSRCSFCSIREFEEFNEFGYCHSCGCVRIFNESSTPHLGKSNANECVAISESEMIALRNFSDKDYEIIRKALLKISISECKLITMHFWENLAIREIANKTGVEQAEIEAVLQSAYRKLRLLCLEHNEFRRDVVFEVEGESLRALAG